jgi:hypothetical protein
MTQQQRILSKNLTEIFSLLQYQQSRPVFDFLGGQNVNAFIPYLFSLKAFVRIMKVERRLININTKSTM